MNNIQLSKEKVSQLLIDLESEQVERTISLSDTDKFAQAICAFSNDLPNTARNGYLLLGANDNGELSGIKANDKMLQSLGGLRSDGNILPQPIMSVNTFSYDEGDLIVIEIQPSPFPPVRYKGRTWIRVGPRKAVANEMEERILIERRTSNVSTFDIRPSLGNGLDNFELSFFKENYLKQAIDRDVLEKDHRTIEEQLASLRFYSHIYNSITNAGLLLFGKNVESYLPGAYIQFVKFNGLTNAAEPVNEKKFNNNLFKLLPELDTFIDYAIIQQRPVPVSTLKEKKEFNYPKWAVRELLMNAVMHRDYESNAPIKFYQYSDRIEIINPGGLYGNARPENFPNVNDYRNPIVAEAMKVLGYVNRFNRGIARVEKELEENGNIKPVFNYKQIGVFGVVVFATFIEQDIVEELSPSVDETKEKTKGISKGKALKSGEKSKEETSVKTSEKTKKTVEDSIGTVEETVEVSIGTVEETVEDSIGTVEETVEKTKTRIIALMKDNPNVTAKEIEKIIGLSRRGVEYNINNLKKSGIIRRIGSTKGGHWEVINDK